MVSISTVARMVPRGMPSVSCAKLNEIAQTVSRGACSTTALTGSTEEEQFYAPKLGEARQKKVIAIADPLEPEEKLA